MEKNKTKNCAYRYHHLWSENQNMQELNVYSFWTIYHVNVISLNCNVISDKRDLDGGYVHNGLADRVG
jgi:hypothetical protein